MVLGLKVFDKKKSEDIIVTKHTISENRGDKLLILLVEDNKINQKVASGILNKLNFSVVIAKHPCMLKYNREQRRKPNYVARAVNIDKESSQLATYA